VANIPGDLQYTEEHEYVRKGKDGNAEIGITDYAQGELGDVVYVELPKVGSKFNKHDVFGTIEAVKAVSELFAPVSGEVVAVNPELGTHPEAVNAKPHDAWMIRLHVAAADEVNGLLDANAYTALVK